MAPARPLDSFSSEPDPIHAGHILPMSMPAFMVHPGNGLIVAGGVPPDFCCCFCWEDCLLAAQFRRGARPKRVNYGEKRG